MSAGFGHKPQRQSLIAEASCGFPNIYFEQMFINEEADEFMGFA
jgi:hypothetical protein